MKRLLLGASIIAITTFAGIAVAADDQMNQSQPAETQNAQTMPATGAPEATTTAPDANLQNNQQSDMAKDKNLQPAQPGVAQDNKDEMPKVEIPPANEDAAQPAQKNDSNY